MSIHWRRAAIVTLLLLPPMALPAQEVRWTVSREPVLNLGSGASAHEEFYEVLPVMRLSNGTVVVPNASTHDVRFFDSTGRHIATAGRQGGGPGEFRSLSDVGRLHGDTVFVFDWQTRRLTFIDASGRIAGEETARGMVRPIALLSNGNVLGTRSTGGGDSWEFAGREGEKGQRLMTFTAVTRAGQVLWSSEPVVRGEVFGMPFSARGRDYMAPMDLPFGRTTSWTVYRDTLFYGTGDAFRLTVVAPDGRVVRTIGDDRAPQRLSSGVAAGFRGQVVAGHARGSGEVRQAFLTSLDRGRVPLPSHTPAHGRVLSDSGGLLWVQDGDADGSSYLHLVTGGGKRPGSRMWTVLQRDGRVLQRVEMPAGLRVDEIGPDYVLGVWRDEFDVEHVRLHTLQRR